MSRVDNKEQFVSWLREFATTRGGRRRSLSGFSQRDVREFSQMSPTEVVVEVAHEGYQRVIDAVEDHYEVVAPVTRMIMQRCCCGGGGGSGESS